VAISRQSLTTPKHLLVTIGHGFSRAKKNPRDSAFL
jgi:hypothetical protein